MKNLEKLSPHSENKDENSEKLSRHLEKEDDALWEDRLKWREKSLDKEEST